MADGDVLQIVAGHQAFAVPTGGGSSAAGFVLAGLLTCSGSIPATGNFYAIPVANTYDPDGYYSANLPQGGIPGFLIPVVGDGKVHRVTLDLTVDLSGPTGVEDSTFVMAAIVPTTTLAAGDIRVFDASLLYGSGSGEGVGVHASWAGVLSTADEIYVFAKQTSVTTAAIRVGYVTIERLAS